MPVELINPPVKMLPPVMLAADVIVEVALIKPPVNTLPPLMLAADIIFPDALMIPVMYSPVLAYVATGIPVTPTVTL